MPVKFEARRKILEHEFSIPMTREISEEMESMDSMSRAIMNESRAQGLEEGLAQGRKEMQQEMQKKLDDLNTKMLRQTLASIKGLSDGCGISYEEAMNRIGIPESEQAEYLELLRKS
jgi:fructose-1,6-bisphosphatase